MIREKHQTMFRPKRKNKFILYILTVQYNIIYLLRIQHNNRRKDYLYYALNHLFRYYNIIL